MFDRHTFSTELAAKLGVHAAIVFHYMAYWVYENAINKRNFKDGKYWTYNSIAALQTHFYYMSAKTITRAIEKLVDAGYIESGCYNQDPYDRTKWYTLTDDAMKIYPINDFLNKGRPLRQNDQNDCPKRENPLGQNDLADLDKVTNSNTIITNNYNKENNSNNINIIPIIKESDKKPQNEQGDKPDFKALFIEQAKKMETDENLQMSLAYLKITNFKELANQFYRHIINTVQQAKFIKNGYTNNCRWLKFAIPDLDLSKARGKELGPGEMIDDDGNRYYINQWSGTKIIVPDDAPPRPSKNHIWARSEGCWITN